MQVNGKVTMPISGQAKILWGDNEEHILPEAFKNQVHLLPFSKCSSFVAKPNKKQGVCLGTFSYLMFIAHTH